MERTVDRALSFKAVCLLSVLVCSLSVNQPAVADCAAVPGNAVPNCGFEAGNPPMGWTLSSGDSLASHATARSGLASAAIDAAGPSFFIADIDSSCFPIVSDPSYGYGGYFITTSPVGCIANLTYFSDSGCIAQIGVATGNLIQASTTEWTLSSGSLDTTGIGSGRLSLSCASLNGDFTLLLDDAFAGPGLVPVELMHFAVE